MMFSMHSDYIKKVIKLNKLRQRILFAKNRIFNKLTINGIK